MASIGLEQVSKRYPSGVWAIRDLSLNVADGEFVVLVGPSGCGKTSTLRIIAGLEEATLGQIRIDGKAVNGMEPYRRDVAMVFQRPALYPHLNIRRNLLFGLHLRRGFWPTRLFDRSRTDVVSHAEMESRLAATAQMLGLQGLLNRRPSELSGGQQQRVAIGRAVIRRPSVFLLDEPLNGLDLPLRTEMRSELHLLQRALRATMIYVTHDQTEAMTLGDRVVVLDRGIVQQIDTPVGIYQRPANRFVAEFMGSPKMSFLDGELVRDERALRFVGPGGDFAVPENVALEWVPLIGQKLSLGIRPENICLERQGSEVTIQMKVAQVENLGSRFSLTLEHGGWRLNTMVNDRPPEVNEPVVASLELSRSHLFDRETGVVKSQAELSG